jgi:hypothetical protein
MRYSKDGYRLTSRDFHQEYNLIPSGSISMKLVPFPILAMDNLGNIKILQPNEDHLFQGNQVLELPLRNGELNRLSDGELRQKIIEKAIEVEFLRGLSWRNLRIK